MKYMKRSIVVIMWIMLLSLAMVGCDDKASKEKEPRDIKEMVERYSAGDFEDLSASITSQELIVTNGNKNQSTYELPNDEFFVSIAPFLQNTHPCENHSLTGCQGELKEEEFEVHIMDEDGNVIINERMTSLENGFLDLWLKRDKTYEVKIEHNGKMAESKITTFDGDNTCITTMQLI